MFNKLKVSELVFHSHDLRYGIWNGTVVDNQDPKQLDRIKVSIPELTEGIEFDKLPWYSGKRSFLSNPNSQGNIPPLGSQVVVEFPDNDIYNGLYSYVLVSHPPDKK